MAMFMGGGGFMGGASQFAGDQFMQPSPGEQVHESGGKKQSSTETVRSVTIRQILRDCMDSSTDVMMVDGHELQLLTLVGRVVQMTEIPGSCINYTLHDGTGAMGGLLYVNDMPDQVLNRQRDELRVGNYVRVFGVLRQISNEAKLSFQSYKTRPVTDFNEITYHNLQVIFQRLHLKQGSAPNGGVPMPNLQTVAMPQGQQGMGMAPAPAPAGMSLVDQLNALYHSPEVMSLQQGIHIDQVLAILKKNGNNYTMNQVKQAVEALVSDGHLYSTINDDTHRVC